jgi:predicted amidophosphoribosyltransferase
MTPAMKNTESKSFQWPPQTPDIDQSPHARRQSIPIRLPNRMIESIETQLLGRTTLAFDRWALRTGWTRDDQSVFCWRCAGSIGPHESDGEGCASCRSKPLPWGRAIRLGRHEGVLRDEVLALKFGRWRATGNGLGEHLGLAIRAQLIDAQIQPAQVLLVPIPMHRFRRMARGIDHTTVLARAAARSSGCGLRYLLRTHFRPEQVGLSMTARAQNIRGAFYCSARIARLMDPKKEEPIRLVVLIDDVRTTGATFVAATKALKQGFKSHFDTHKGGKLGKVGGPQIWIASIGVAGEGRRQIDVPGSAPVPGRMVEHERVES